MEVLLLSTLDLGIRTTLGRAIPGNSNTDQIENRVFLSLIFQEAASKI